MIKIEHYLIDEFRGYQVVFKNDATEKNLYLVCPIGTDLEQFKVANLSIAIVETT